MKNKKLFAVPLLAASLLVSCNESFLEVTPQGVAVSTQLSSKAGVNALLIGAYSLLDGVGSSTTNWHAAVSNWVYGGVASDDAYKGTDAGDQPEISFIERYDWQSNLLHLRGKWQHGYDAVSRANLALQMIPNAKDMTDAEKTLATAEARFLRGHYYFELRKMFKMVPFIDDKQYNVTDFNSTKVPNDKDIFANIEADFKFAMDNLPINQGQKGRATKYAAMAYLGKAYIFQNKWSQAKPLFDEIINSNKYRLVDYHDNFKAVTNNNPESIFEVQFSVNDGTTGGNGNSGDVLNWPYFSNAPGGGCCGFYQPSQNLVNAFKTDAATGLPLIDTFNDKDLKNDEGVKQNEAFTPEPAPVDPRLDWTVGRRGIPFLDWGPMPGVTWIRDQSYAGPYTGKKWMYYKAEEGTNTHATSKRSVANNYRMIRLSHVILWQAEVETELSNLNRARELVNLIRRRAKTSTVVTGSDGKPAANYLVNEYDVASDWFKSQANARKAVRFEHRLEFGMEGHRFFDLVRWGIAAETLNAYISKEAASRKYLAGAQFKKGINEYFPLPIDEITNSSLNGKPTLTQNSGY